MKNNVKKLLAVLVALTLVFAMFTGMNVSAAEAEMKLPEGFEFIDGEIYSFRETLEMAVSGLDHTAMDEVYFDGYPWNVSHRQNFTDGPWGIKENWVARESYGWDGFKCICITPTTDEQNSEIWKNHEMMIEWNEADENDKNVYWSLQPLWSCSSNTWINFVAPHTGKIVLFEEFGNDIKAYTENYSFYADNYRPWKITVEKNDVKVWPMEEDYAVLDNQNLSTSFPSLGKTGVMPVTEGDIISIRIDAAGEFESGAGYDYEGKRISGNTTAIFNPVIAYTEIEEPVEEPEDTYEDVDDTTGNTGDSNNDAANNNDDADAKDEGLGWILYVIIGGAVLVVGAGAAVAVILIKKKKGTTPPEN